ncbi:MAG TPA: glycosyltransferase family 39 protein [Ignavibacteriaceae bacterium]|nr:glycosyltransferase family 39 protein [Ignavibacteriaceae bacterium]
MKTQKIDNGFFLSTTFVLISFSLFKFLLHFTINLNGAYGFFRDEFYFIACSNHLAWGYVDQPPFAVIMLSVSRFFLGDSLIAIRFLPALLGAINVFTTGKIAKELGGGIFAQAAAAICMIIAPVYLAYDSTFSLNTFDVFFWIISFYLVILIIKNDKKNLWYLLGVVIGLGLMNKISILWFCAGLFIGLVSTKHRKILLSKEPWFAFLIAVVIFLPNILWQTTHDYPMLEFMQNALKNKYVMQSPLDFFKSIFLMENPITLPVWIFGLYYLLFNKSVKEYKFIGIIFITVLIILLVNPSSKANYLASVFPVLFAGGSIFFEKLFEKREIFWPKPVIIILLSLSIWVAPLAAPILPVKSYISFAKSIGMKPSTSEKKELGELPQFFADMFGWKEMTETVKDVCEKLTPEEKKSSIIFCGNYGEAGSINFFGKKYNLPPAVSGHNNYYLWGPVRKNINVVIVLGSNRESLDKIFVEVIAADTLRLSQYSMPYENNQPVWICKTPKKSVNEIWPTLKHYE